MRVVFFIFFFCICLSSSAQVNEFQKSYDEFSNQAKQEYTDFRKKCNAEYAEFLRLSWESYQAAPIMPMPKDEIVPPVVMPKEDIDKPINPKPIPIDTVVTPIMEESVPQPKPIAPIYEKTQPEKTFLSFTFFGTEGKVRMPANSTNGKELLGKNLSGENIARLWDAWTDDDYDNMLRDCLELHIRHNLCDWAYLLMIRELSEKYWGGKNNTATLFTAWIFCQSGYQMRLASSKDKLYMLFGSKHDIYGMSYFTIDDTNFYPFLHDEESIDDRLQICSAAFPEEKPLSLFIPIGQEFAKAYRNNRSIKSERFSNVEASVRVNQNLMDFYSTYPTSVLGENIVSRWAMYANTPMATDVKEQLYPQLRRFITGKSQQEAANILLNWVQTGFEYEYDDKVWGGDRAFFAEESLNYPYCDCEDRSILFTRLVRDLLGLKCILIYYPGHLACAVNFSEDVNGDYIMLEGRKFVITDPTYIGAPVGYTMPDMDNVTAKVILLQ